MCDTGQHERGQRAVRAGGARRGGGRARPRRGGAAPRAPAADAALAADAGLARGQCALLLLGNGNDKFHKRPNS